MHGTKALSIVAGVALVAIGAYLLLKGPAPRPYVPEPSATLPGATTTPREAIIEESDAPGYATYTDGDGAFTFAFPTHFDVADTSGNLEPGWSAPATTKGLILAKLEVPKTVDPGTNFTGAAFTVGKSADRAAVASCLKNLSGTSATSTVFIGDTTFTKLEFAGAAAGSRRHATSYRVVRDTYCWAIEYTIHSTNIQNYPEGEVDEFDEAAITRALEEVVRSFRFLK